MLEDKVLVALLLASDQWSWLGCKNSGGGREESKFIPHGPVTD